MYTKTDNFTYELYIHKIPSSDDEDSDEELEDLLDELELESNSNNNIIIFKHNLKYIKNYRNFCDDGAYFHKV